MATTTTRNAKAVRAEKPARYRFTVEQYERMGETGILDEDERVELIKGELIQMAAVGNRHVACVNALNMAFVPQVQGRAVVSVQNPVRLVPDSEPQPDLVLIRFGADGNRQGIPDPGNALLVIEVSDSSLGYDLRTKAGLYAERGIPELWVWDLPNQRVHAFRGLKDGRYQERSIALPGDILEPRLLPGVRISVADMLGPEDS